MNRWTGEREKRERGNEETGEQVNEKRGKRRRVERPTFNAQHSTSNKENRRNKDKKNTENI